MNTSKIANAVLGMVVVGVASLTFEEGKVAARALVFAVDLIDKQPLMPEEEMLARLVGFIKDQAEGDTMNAMTPMPLYECHKEVWALKIKEVKVHPGEEGPQGATITPEDFGFAPFEVDATYVIKHQPKPGGYFVQYKDGYKSFSPQQAFEEGYTRVSGT